MSSTRVLTVAGAAIAPLLAALPASAQTVLIDGSEAYGISATFTSDHMTTKLGPTDAVHGSLPHAYSKTRVVTSYDQSIAVPPLVPATPVEPVVPTFTAQAIQQVAHVASAGIGVDNVSTTGSSTIASANLRIAVIPPAPTTTPAQLYLSVVAGGVADQANYSKVFPNAASVSGSASFGSLTITGSLVNSQTITYSGAAPANTVLYQSPTVTVTANRQTVVGLISCSPHCSFVPTSITVHALDISLTNAPLKYGPVTGEIVLGDSSAY